MNDRGWTCFSTNESGYVIELVQMVVGQRTGRALNCYEAGKWLLENGLSRVTAGFLKTPAIREQKQGSTCNTEESGEAKKDDGKPGAAEKKNEPIRQTLLPALAMGHPEFKKRGISQGTCAYLGCGYLPERSKSPMAGRLVFQVRGLREDAAGTMQPVVLTHMGRAMTEEQEEEDGKWWMYGGFQKTLELYNIDHAILDKEAVRQARETGHVIVTEGCFDVAKLVEADIRNVVATFGAHLAEEQTLRLKQITDSTGVREFLFWYDRDKAGGNGQKKAL